jgi:hypothetical protein
MYTTDYEPFHFVIFCDLLLLPVFYSFSALLSPDSESVSGPYSCRSSFRSSGPQVALHVTGGQPV